MFSTEVPARRVIGKLIRLSRPLGSGANGDAYLAEVTPQHKLNNSAVGEVAFPAKFVVKVMRRRLCTAARLEVIHRELLAVRTLQHPYIVDYIDAWLEASEGPYHGCYCLAINYCDGGDVHDLICHLMAKKQYATVDLVVKLMAHVFAALNYSHAQKIIHRDIKPANVFLQLSPDGHDVAKAMVGDYGLSRPLEETAQLVETRVGTPCYCSPEIVRGEPYSTKTDIFSAGVMFYELMALERPFWRRGYQDAETFRDILHKDPIPRLHRLAEERYGRGLVRVVEGCLLKAEKDRPSAYDVLCHFSVRLTRYVQDAKITLYAERQRSPVGVNKPANADSPLPRRRSPPPLGSPSRPRRASPPPAAEQPQQQQQQQRWEQEGRRTGTPTPCCDPAAAQPHEVRGGVEVALSHEARIAPTSTTPNASATLMKLMQAVVHECAAPTNAQLLQLLEDDYELLLLLRVVTVSRAKSRAEMENGLFKLLLALRPSCPVREIVHLLTTSEGDGED